jgi:hypothetical protein
MSQNPDSVVNQGEFAGHVKPSEPLMKGGVSSSTSPLEVLGEIYIRPGSLC